MKRLTVMIADAAHETLVEHAKTQRRTPSDQDAWLIEQDMASVREAEDDDDDYHAEDQLSRVLGVMPFSPRVARHIAMHGLPQVMVIYRDIDQPQRDDEADDDVPAPVRGGYIGGDLTPIGSPIPGVGDFVLVKLPDGEMTRFQVIERAVTPGLHGEEGDCTAVELCCKRMPLVAEGPATNGVAEAVPA